jgi:hypothetical protein
MAPPKSRLSENEAETIALQVLTFLLADPTQISRFFALTGMTPQDLQGVAESRDLQAAILEYLLSDERILLTFCQQAGVDPAIMAPAHVLLTGTVSYE